jgi:hypothetical protein
MKHGHKEPPGEFRHPKQESPESATKVAADLTEVTFGEKCGLREKNASGICRVV